MHVYLASYRLSLNWVNNFGYKVTYIGSKEPIRHQAHYNDLKPLHLLQTRVLALQAMPSVVKATYVPPAVVAFVLC